MKELLKSRGKLLLALFAILTLALTALIGIGIAKPNVAYAEETAAAKEQLTKQIRTNEADVDKMEQYGYAYYWSTSASTAHGYPRRTLVLNGLDMVYGGTNAIAFNNNPHTLVLADGSVNKIRIALGSYPGNYHRAIAAENSLTIQGGGKLIIEFEEQSVENTHNGDGRFDAAIYAKQKLTLEHTGSIEVTTARREINYSENSSTSFSVLYTDDDTIEYKSGKLTLNAGAYKDSTKGEGLYRMLYTGGGDNPPAIHIDGGSIVWNAYEGARIELSYPGATIGAGLEAVAGGGANSAEVKTNQADLNNQKYMRIGAHAHRYRYTVTTRPTETEEGSAAGTCKADDGAADTLTLPVLTDPAFRKETRAATTEADAYDRYTYVRDGEDLLYFDVVHAGTKLPSGGGDNGNNGGNTGGGNNNGLSAGAIAGIAVGSVVGVLLLAYILGFFLFFNKGKLAGKFFTTIYKPMSKLFRK